MRLMYRAGEHANTVGVAVTRKPTSAPCDHVKHPERLGVQWHDAGEAIAAESLSRLYLTPMIEVRQEGRRIFVPK